ncbi:hypothetical protein V0U79_06115 [Hyphobacterium sp. HN65]|uniref:Uncharacterized protein n=1 Tax=Hyphobacterium lacteum TaxID=3116575 RepID=A0ABU7LPU0_9PROT|nr:hypothetical protein [Hyphobacterium sp. HN65]MEE2525934.1 hypothetical protein [Hyphobacterium sp. HN65]
MILARLATALRQQNWIAVVIEFVIVIAGVVIGFQITAWNAGRVERSREAVILCRLDEEFGRIEADVRQHVIDAEISMAEAQRIRRDALRGFRLEDIANYTEAAARMRAPPAGSATYDELVSSGEMGLIRSRELREALIDYGEHSDRFYAAGNQLSTMQIISAGSAVSMIGLTEDEIRDLPEPLADELRAHVTSGEFLMAAQALERLALYNLEWKQTTEARVAEVTGLLETETAHCGELS